jgi:ABC-type lipoprotein export system ATPase subunit
MEIRLEGVTKYYYDQGKSTKGIEDVNLTLKTDGSFVVVTGESGAGKSTLIKILTGLEDFDEGEIYFDNVPLSGMSDDQRQKLYSDNISFVFQDYNLVESVTSEENITLALIKQGISVKDAKAQALEALKKVGLEKQAKMRASKLSGGERQRVAIARSLALNTQVIIFDEPTGNLDQETSKNIIELIEKVKGSRLVVYVTHEYVQVKDYVTRHITLADGHVIKDEKIQDLADLPESKETNKPKSGKFPFKSYLYAASLFSFRRIGRFIATFIVLLVASMSVLGGAFGYTAALYVASGISNSFVVNNKPYDLFGTDVAIKKKEVTDADYQITSHDYFADKGRLVTGKRFFLFLSGDLQYGEEKNQQISSSEYATPITYVPFEYTEVQKADNNTGLASATIVFTSSYGAKYSTDFKERYKTALAMLGMPLSVSNWSSFSFYDKASSSSAYTDADLSVIHTIPKICLTSVCTSDDYAIDEYGPVLIVPKDFMQSLHDFQAKKISTFLSAKQESNLGSTYPNSTFIDSNVSTTFYEDESHLLTYDEFLFDTTNATTEMREAYYSGRVLLPKSLQGKDPFMTLDGIKIPLSSFNPYYFEVDHTKYAYDSTYAVWQFAVVQKAIESNIYMTVTLPTVDLAKAEYNNAVGQNRSAFLYLKASSQLSTTVKLATMDELSVSTRIGMFFGLIAILFFMFVAMIIIKLILNKFYYRKDYDQMVLSYIGYSFKDMIVINLMQFLVITLLAVSIVYPCFLFTWSYARMLLSFYPNLIILSFVICLVFGLVLALPRRQRGGNK